METIIEPALDSVAGNIEIAIYMTSELEDALSDICSKSEQRVKSRLEQLHNAKND